MKFLRDLLDKQKPLFEKGGKFEKLYPLFEANETILFTPGKVTRTGSHVRDGLDLKRMMITVVVALIPCILIGVWNIGYQANSALADGAMPEGWRGAVMTMVGISTNPESIIACFLQGLLYYLPLLAVTFAIGGHAEVLFSVVRKHEINEGFLVTGMLFPLIVPPTLPLWQAALGIIFGVVIGKEIFGGTGMNILNPALTARAFLFFAYPAQISGDKVWTAVGEANQADGFSGATVLGQLATAKPDEMESILAGLSWMDAFIGRVPGSIGEVSTLACILGAVVLLVTGVGSWRTMLGVVVGSVLVTAMLNFFGSETNTLMNLPFHWQFVLGGWAFGTVYMATDPVSAAHTNTGRYVYGFLIGIFAILIRVVNPAYPEGMMLAVLFMNVFSPLIDHVVISANIRRRVARSAA